MIHDDTLIVAVSGSRHVFDIDFIYSTMDLYDLTNCVIHVGDAKGVDECIRKYCKSREIPHKVFYADWHKYGKSAGPIRNEAMIHNASLLIAFPAQDSKGTVHAIRFAESLTIPVDKYTV